MIRLVTGMLLFLLFAPVIAQESQTEKPYLMGVKTSEGLLVVVNGSTCHYTFHLKGKEIRHPQDDEDLFIVDNKALVFHARPLDKLRQEFDARDASEEEILVLHASGEMQYFEEVLKQELHAQKSDLTLATGGKALYWRYTTPEEMAAKGVKKQLYVSTISGNTLLLLNTVLTGDDTEEESRDFLLSTISTLRVSKDVIDPQWIADSVRSGK